MLDLPFPQVMTHGPSVKIPCVQHNLTTAPSFEFPAEWGGSLMQCREPAPCLADFPEPPVHSGLKVRKMGHGGEIQILFTIRIQFFNLIVSSQGKHFGGHRGE